MATITDKPNLFFITSPRSPYKMKDEIALLAEKFSGQKWVANRPVQEDFYRELVNSDFFDGVFEGDITFKARDRITRGPKALGLISLEPIISLTDAGHDYVYGRRPHETFTRQLLKFQFPSPFHVDSQGDFFVRPYLVSPHCGRSCRASGCRSCEKCRRRKTRAPLRCQRRRPISPTR